MSWPSARIRLRAGSPQPLQFPLIWETLWSPIRVPWHRRRSMDALWSKNCTALWYTACYIYLDTTIKVAKSEKGCGTSRKRSCENSARIQSDP